VNIQKNKVLIENELKKAISKHYFKQKQPLKPVKLEGKTRLIFENGKTFLHQLLEVDKKEAPFQIISLEQKYKTELQVKINGEKKKVLVGGTIDRVDFKNGFYRILDYKTGNVNSLSFSNLEELFEYDKEKPKKEILQALIYCLVFSKENQLNNQLRPTIYGLKDIFSESFSPYIKRGKTELSFAEIQADFEYLLEDLLGELFSVDTVFYQTPHEKNCNYCSYNKICQRF
jgi:hypothetical protein